MKSKLSDLASIAEIIGAIAVVISLLYVGAQVNDSASAVRSAAANDANVALQNWYLEIGSDRETSEIFYRTMVSEEPAVVEEEFQFIMMLHGAFLAFQNSYLLAEEGTIDVELREAITAAIAGVKDTPGVQRYWRQRKSYLHKDFVEYAEELFEQEANTSMDMYRTSDDE